MTFHLGLFGNEIDFAHLGIRELLMFMLALACLQLVIAAVIVCARSRVKNKGWWIAIIVLLDFTVKLAGEVCDISIFILHYTFDIDIPWVFSFAVPLGAILFLCMRKRLERSTGWHAAIRRQSSLPY